MKVTTVSASDGASVRDLLMELWNYRSLIWAFSVRDLKVKYFQTVFGPLWVVLTPLITVGVMTFVFGLMIKVPSDGLPYLMFYMLAIVPWLSFTTVFYMTMGSLESNSGLLNKIYFPRLVIGASYALNGTIDFAVGVVTSIVLALYFDIFSMQFLVAVPILLFVQMAWALGLGFGLAPYNAQYRDVKLIVPLFMQLYYFACPILYPESVAPWWAQWLFHLNPMAAVITTYRATLNGTPIAWGSLAFAIVFATGVLAWGAYIFMKKERAMVDVL